MLSNAVPGEAAANQATAQVCHTTALQLLLRLLPFKQAANKDNRPQQLADNRHALVEELHKHPLWRYSSLDQRPAWRMPLRNVAPPHAHEALLDYLRMAADADEAQRTAAQHRYRRNAPATAAEAAAELHAVYALAAVHAASQQQLKAKQPAQEQRLNSNDFLTLLRAYAALNEQPEGTLSENSAKQHYGASNRWQEEGAAAAVQALYAFAALTESATQQQQETDVSQAGSCSTPLAASKHSAIAGQHEVTPFAEAHSHHIDSSIPQQQELQVLLKLAELGAHS